MRFSEIVAVSQVLSSALVFAKPVQISERQIDAATVQSVGDYFYAGCAAEPFYNGYSGRALTDSSKSSSTMSVEICASLCSGYTYFGVEHASECYCGNTYTNGTTLDSDDSNCNDACSGNATEYCGGSRHLNLYITLQGSRSSNSLAASGSSTVSSFSSTSNPAAASTSSASTTFSTVTISSSSYSSTSAPTAVSAASNYNFVACAVEPFENGLRSRALVDYSTSTSSMTVEYCAAYCIGYEFFGVEYSSQCYCGNVIQNGTTLDQGGKCDMACAGNSTEQCGGSSRLNLYKLVGGATVNLPTAYSATATSTTSSSGSTSSLLAMAITTITTVTTTSLFSPSSSTTPSTTTSSTIPTITASTFLPLLPALRELLLPALSPLQAHLG